MKVVVVDEFFRSPARRAIYNGMNWWAAQELGIPFPHDQDTVLVTRPWTVDQVARHEEVEAGLMASGANYDEAHRVTLLSLGK